jgi:glycosyltransferase involved in cell wall biosynthesis
VPRVPTAISKHFDALQQNTLIASLENRHDTQVPNVKGEKGSQTQVAEEESAKMKEKEKGKELNTFGVYLGSFARPPTPSQTRLLHLWDVVVLDPFADGVVSGLEAADALASSHILGRLDVVRLTRSDGSKSTKEVIGAVDAVSHVLRNVFHHQSARFTGVLLADFTSHFQPLVLNRLVNYIRSLGLDVWLELSYPNYLTLTECIQIDFHRVRGVVYRNATIRTDGLQQNVHQMEALRTAQRGIAKQKVPQSLPMMLWETVDHGAALDYAICQRTFAWCRYNSAIPWIAPSSALYDVDVALEQAVTSAPLGALMWLKDENNMKAHDFWRLNNDISQEHDDSADLYRSLDDFVPALANRLQPLSREQKSLTTAPSIPKISLPTRQSVDRLSDVFSVSVDGDSFTGLGCFHLGLEASFNDFAELVMAQREFRHLNLLRELAADEKSGILAAIKAMDEARLDTNLSSPTYQAVKDLLTLLTSSAEEDSRRLSIYVGLHSGFQTSAQVQFWGLYDVDAASGSITIFLSKSNANLAGTVLHTFLSSRGVNRGECLLAEFAMSKANASLDKRWNLPSRIVSDVQKLSPEELLLFLRRMVDLEDGDLLGRLRCCVKYQLIEAPTLLQLRITGSGDYLDGKISSKELIAARLQWLADKGASCPDLSTATTLFDEVEARLYNVLMTGQSETYAKISAVTQSLCKSAKVTASADIFLLAVFKAFQKFALDEVYLEVMDRLVYPNHAEDQAGVFAELFALGSRCESFFDTTARVIGTVLANRMRAYYMEFQPPRRPDVFTELPTAYAGMQTDDDSEDGGQEVPFHYKLTFLGIFAVPALIDIALLTTIGRGLYLTTFMSSTEKTTATTALMFALVSCGAVGGWISSGGSYYLFANAFPAMNMFVLTRFVAGIAVVLIGGTAGMITFAVIESSIVAGLVFFYYFGMLATYLMTLSALSIYQVPGSNFLSGRTVIMSRIPILFISPILTMWVGHDIIVYVCVLTLFLFTLLLGARDVMAKWSVWYLNIPTVTDGEVLKWYLAKSGTNVTAEGIGSSSAPRQALVAAVQKEQNRSSLAKWWKPTNDVLVAKLAAGYESSKFLMVWYCRFKRSRMPYVYSSSWNLTLKAGLEAMTNMQKGLKLHSAFLHWRHTGSDIWSAILYFVVALLDKWAAMLSGGALVGLSAANSEEFRLSVGFGLCYYLIGAVSLDTVSQPLWTAANEQTIQPILSIAFLRKVNRNDKAARRTLYWQNFFKFLFLHIWGMVITSAMMWLFTESKNAAIMYIAYLGAYTGLLWYQYNKIYCGSEAARALAAAAIVGLPIGIALHVNLPTFAYSGVVSLAVGTWIACIYSLWLSQVGWPSPFARCIVDDSVLFLHDEDEEKKIIYSSSTIGQDKEYSDATLEKMYIHMKNVLPDRTLRLQPTAGVGLNVMKVLTNQKQIQQPAYIRKAFSTAPDMIQKTVDLWTGGKISVDLVSAQSRSCAGKFSTSACKRGDEVHLVICLGVNLSDITFQQENHRNYIIIAESIMQASAEHCLGLSHEDSLMAQVLVTVNSSRHTTKIPESMKLLMETSLPDRLQSYKDSEKIFLYHFLLKVQSETEWDRLPVSIRSYLVAKCCAEQIDLTPEQQAWIVSRCTGRDRLTVDEFLHRCDGQADLALGIKSFISAIRTDFDSGSSVPSWEDRCDLGIYSSFEDPAIEEVSRINTTRRSFIGVGQKMQTCIKFLVLTLTADFEYQRELDFTMKGTPAALHLPLTFFLNCIWSGCKLLQDFVLPAVLFHKRPHISSLCSNMKHMKTVMEKHRTVIESLEGPSTCFVTPVTGGGSSISQYSGHHDSEPGDRMELMAINIYAKGMLLIRRQVYKERDLVSEYVYDYPVGTSSKLPTQRRCVRGAKESEIVQYDERCYITTGSYVEGVNRVNFTYWYRKNACFEDELLRGEYVFPHITIRVNWSMPPRKHVDRLDEWIPHVKVTEATFIEGDNIHHTSWGFDHKFETEMSTTLNSRPVSTPPFILEDWFHVLDKPKNCAFLNDNPFLAYSSTSFNIFSRALRLNMKHCAVSTSHARIQLWKAWKTRRDIDAVTARWLDERLVRADSTLKPYWRMRDMGCLTAASAYVDAHADTIMARVDLDPDTSSWVHIAFKIADFYSFGLGGDTTINTRTVNSQLRDTHEELHVLAMDTSTFPMEPGGVSACRRDLVNDLKTIKWHLMAESANDYGVPRFQIERNIQSLTLLPLWGLDFLNPTHGVMINSLDSAVVERSQSTNAADITKNFLPILTSLVRVVRKKSFKMCDIEEATRVLVDLNTYFESSRNWNDVWNSPVVKQTWRELWLVEQTGTLNIQDWWDFERPTIMQMDTALNMWHRYLFIFSITVPENIPDVFQASHHFTGATYGILCKVKRKCTLHVWDHCISFRELTTFMSSAVSFDSPFVNSSLIGLGHLSCVLLEHHADVVLPCAAHFNPGWEVELGTSQGAMMHRKTFQRKIDPVVNGICNMEKFEPIQKIKTATPTAIMLSHIQFVKDIKNAIMATDFIVNKWGFRDYQLHIYGDMERAAGQAVECQELIASKNLGEHCILKGLGRPDVALQDAWLFLNSSISEGLPLAMGEAALTGVPVVCTDVGASFCVVTDEESGERFSEVVAPNDSESLARAQISVMALVGQWSEYGEDEPGFVVPVLEYPTPKPESVSAIHSRMIEKQEQRRKLGMMGRKNVLKNFSSERYLREHEQMLWIGKYSSTSHRHHRRTASQKSRPQSVAESSILAQCIEQSSRPVFGSCRDSGIATPSRTPRLSPETWDALSSKSTSPSTASTLWERIISKPLRPGYKRHRTNSSVGSGTAPDEELGIPMVSMLPKERSPNYSGTPIVSLTSAHQNPTPVYKLAQHEMNAADKTPSRLQTKYHEAVGLGISLSKRPVYSHAGTASNSPLMGSPLASPALT